MLAVHLMKIALSMILVETVKSAQSIQGLLVFSSNIRSHSMNNESWVCCASILRHLCHLPILELEIYSYNTEPWFLA